MEEKLPVWVKCMIVLIICLCIVWVVVCTFAVIDYLQRKPEVIEPSAESEALADAVRAAHELNLALTKLVEMEMRK